MSRNIPFGTLPSREQFDIAFIEVTGPSRTFAFKGVSFFAPLLWMTLIDRLSISNMPEKHAGTGEPQAARLWCSEALAALGFKWTKAEDEPDPHKEVLFRKLRRRFAEYEEAVTIKDSLSQKNAKRAILDELP